MAQARAPKERLLETAHKLFYHQGYHVTGINEILEQAGVAKASLYKHFGSKEALGVEYVKKVREDWFTSLASFLSRKQDPKQKILAAFDYIESTQRSHDFNGCRFLNLLAEVDKTSRGMQKEIVAHKTKVHAMFKSLVSQYIASGVRLAIPNAHDVIYLLFEACLIESKVYQDHWPITAARKAANNILTTVL